MQKTDICFHCFQIFALGTFFKKKSTDALKPDLRILILVEADFIFLVFLLVVTKLVNRGYQPHLEDFLLRINFNNYYKDN